MKLSHIQKNNDIFYKQSIVQYIKNITTQQDFSLEEKDILSIAEGILSVISQKDSGNFAIFNVDLKKYWGAFYSKKDCNDLKKKFL